MFLLTGNAIDPKTTYDSIQKKTVGSVILHYAVVRERTGDQVTKQIEFQQNGDIEFEMNSISDSLFEKWALEDVLIIRRLGVLKVGDIMSLVSVSAPRSKDAFEACHFGVESLKKMKFIKKTEI